MIHHSVGSCFRSY